jgi:hypothetical protein
VLLEVQGALQEAQDVLAASSLPPLQSVQLTLHTQAERDATGKARVLLMSFGGGPGASASQELVLTMIPPKPKAEAGVQPLFVRPPTAAASIVAFIRAAAEAVRTAENGKPPLEAKTLTLDLAFTVTQALGGELQFDLGVVSANVGGDVKNSSEQRIKITFGR